MKRGHYSQWIRNLANYLIPGKFCVLHFLPKNIPDDWNVKLTHLINVALPLYPKPTDEFLEGEKFTSPHSVEWQKGQFW